MRSSSLPLLLLASVACVPGTNSAPALTAVAASGITDSQATISWATDIPSDSFVEWGESSAYSGKPVMSARFVTSHSLELTGLSPSATYHYRVTSCVDGRCSSSTDSTFTTTATPAGHDVATVRLSGPTTAAAGDSVTIPAALTPVTATAADLIWSSGPACGGLVADPLTIVSVTACEASASSCSVSVPSIPAGAVVVALIATAGQGGTPAMSSPSLTFSNRVVQQPVNGTAAVATAVAGGALTDEAITVTHSGSAATSVTVVVLTGADATALSNAIGHSDTNANPSMSITVNAKAAGSYVLAACNTWKLATATPGPDTVELSDQPDSTDNSGYWAARNPAVTAAPGDVTLSATWSAASSWNCAAIEVEQAPAADVPCTYSLAQATAKIGGSAATGMISAAGVWTAPAPAVDTTYTVFAQSKDPLCTDTTAQHCWDYWKISVQGTAR